MWISNVMAIYKKTRGILICTNFHNIHRECSKDKFFLPKINPHTNNICGYEMIFTMDGLSTYN